MHLDSSINILIPATFRTFIIELGLQQDFFSLLVISIILIIAVSFIGQIPLALFLVLRMTDFSDLEKFQEELNFIELGIDPNIGLLFMFWAFR